MDEYLWHIISRPEVNHFRKLPFMFYAFHCCLYSNNRYIQEYFLNIFYNEVFSEQLGIGGGGGGCILYLLSYFISLNHSKSVSLCVANDFLWHCKCTGESWLTGTEVLLSDTKLSSCIYAVLFVLLFYNIRMLSNIFI